MFEWLRSWFAWQFGLTRLVIATAFLGSFAGLNLRTMGPGPLIRYTDNGGVAFVRCWGWPFPFAEKEPSRLDVIHDMEAERFFDLCHARSPSIRRYELPWTHQTTYHLLRWLPATVSPYYAILDTLFALVPIALILFLQIPRRKALSPTMS